MEKSFTYRGKRFTKIKDACTHHKVRFGTVRMYQVNKRMPIQEALDVCLGSTQYREEKRELYKIVLRDTWNDLGTTQKAANARGGWVCQCQP